jgi:hypothetical protein
LFDGWAIWEFQDDFNHPDIIRGRLTENLLNRTTGNEHDGRSESMMFGELIAKIPKQ